MSQLKKKHHEKNHQDLRLNICGFLWGLAEATIFFLVPDVLISYVALKSLRRALQLIIWVTAGAVLGGVLMYIWGSYTESNAISVVNNVPFVTDSMILKTNQQLSEYGVLAILLGPIYMTPYKIYAVFSAGMSINVLAFIIISILGRATRFVLVALLTSGLVKLFSKWVSYTYARLVLIIVWTIIYVQYFLHNS